jgi:nicotinamidase-related amidase
LPLDLGELLAPAHTAVLTLELQQRVVGLDVDNELAMESRRTFPAIAQLLSVARAANVDVVHCVLSPALVPSAAPNYPLASALAKRGQLGTRPGGDDVIAEIGPEPSDYVVARHHGVGPFTGTELDAVLRRLGTRTLVVTGVSLNLGVLALCIEAVNLNYRVVIATDGVAGTPHEYGQLLLDNTLANLATRLTCAEIGDVWVPD